MVSLTGRLCLVVVVGFSRDTNSSPHRLSSSFAHVKVVLLLFTTPLAVSDSPLSTCAFVNYWRTICAYVTKLENSLLSAMYYSQYFLDIRVYLQGFLCSHFNNGLPFSSPKETMLPKKGKH